MEKISALFDRLDTDKDVDRIRLDIANLIAKCLTEKRETFGNWEKKYFFSAIEALAENCASHRDSTKSLRRCLVSIEYVHVPHDQRSEDRTERNAQIEAVTYGQLIDRIQKLGGMSD